ncbi:hypothetical protein Peur_047994 [Populus x canadensis]
MLADVLKQNSVDNSGMRFDPNARTALAIVKLRAEGIFKIVYLGKIFRYVSISLIEEPWKSSHLAALDIANKKAGCLHCYDPNLRLPLWPSEEAAERNRADPQGDNVVLEKFFHPNFRLCLSLKAQMAADTIQRLEFMPMLRIIYALIWFLVLKSMLFIQLVLVIPLCGWKTEYLCCRPRSNCKNFIEVG